MVDFAQISCEEFVEVLASKEPVPGGGGASALVGAVGTALGNMVGNLTLGKKKYADVEEDIIILNEKATLLQARFIELVGEDAIAFEPLSKAYGLPAQTPEQQQEKAKVMEAALRRAASVPMEIMERCGEAIELHREFGQKGTDIAMSDVGVGVAFCRGALLGASLNVFINTKYMADREYAEGLNQKANGLLEKYTQLADEIYASVAERLQ